MPIKLKRVYEKPAKSDGYRILVDRLWPRGLTKEKAQLDEWAKGIAPSNELRKWFHSNRTKTSEFKRKYLAELKSRGEKLKELAQRAGKTQVTLLYASDDPAYNHAMVLKEHLEKL
ncbi:MAG TPA: DUF488 family protein [candidate division Zixibacteria bacterium]|nr:DUF488 family protein [candidate division Zixibacteria bacterium]